MNNVLRSSDDQTPNVAINTIKHHYALVTLRMVSTVVLKLAISNGNKR